MKKWFVVLAVFFLGFGVSQFLSFFSNKQQPQKPVEITKEATSSVVANLSSREGEASESATVARVIDGDTVELEGGRKLRYIGIDTPETVDPRTPVQCFGVEAKEENKRLVDGKTVRLEKDVSETDKYGRLLRYVYVDDLMVNDFLVRQGFAHASTYPPDVKYNQQLLEAEQEARENERGLWAECPADSNPTPEVRFPQATGLQPGALEERDFGAGQSSCTIKGNISSSGEKIYHMPGCGSHEKTSIDEARGERWFCSEIEAVAAGWRKAKNCP